LGGRPVAFDCRSDAAALLPLSLRERGKKPRGRGLLRGSFEV
jgi:hypothetical protein